MKKLLIVLTVVIVCHHSVITTDPFNSRILAAATNCSAIVQVESPTINENNCNNQKDCTWQKSNNNEG
jgi:hypothetical protein